MLSAKHQAFVNEYLIDFNATRAAQRAGYRGDDNALAVTGYRLLRNAKIAELVKARLSDRAMSADEVLVRLAQHGRADMGPWLTDDGALNIAAMKRDGATHLIHKVKRTEQSGETGDGGSWSRVTTEVELHPAQNALSLLGKHHGLFSEQTQHSGEVIIRVKYGNEGTDRSAAPTASETA